MEVWNLWHVNYCSRAQSKPSPLAFPAHRHSSYPTRAESTQPKWAQANAALEQEVQERRKLELEIRLSEANYRKTAALLT
jgi:hypothetical protein